MRGESVLLDLGANIECDAENLVQFALMGDAFARTVLGHHAADGGAAQCRLGGFEGQRRGARRGRAAARRATPIRFHGFVEGDDIAAGTVDVVVTDGFTGNVALKTAEGMAKLFTEGLRASFRHSTMARIGYLFARGALKKFAHAFRSAAIQRRHVSRAVAASRSKATARPTRLASPTRSASRST